MEGTGWIELLDEADFWRPPARFGSIPVEKEPMGWDRRDRLPQAVSAPFLAFSSGGARAVRES